MDKRTLLAVVLSLALLVGYQYFFPQSKPVTPVQPAQDTREADVGGQISVGDKAVPQAPIIEHQKSLVQHDEGTGNDVTVDGPLYTAIFNSRGAGLKSFKLKNYRNDIDKDSALVEMVNIEKSTLYPFSSTFPESSINMPADVLYEASADSIAFSETTEKKDLIFSWTYPETIRVDKIYTFYPDTYSFDLEVRVTNLSGNSIRQQALLTWIQQVDPEDKGSKYSHEGPISYVKNETVTEKVKKLGEKKFTGPDVSWGGFETKYFIAAMIPEQPSLTRFVVSKDSDNTVFAELEGPKTIITPGQPGAFRYTLYLGPKEYDMLQAQSVGLEQSIEFGSWVKWLCRNYYPHHSGQDHFLATREYELSVHERDAETAAPNEGASGKIQRRQGQTAAGNHGPVPGEQGKSDERVSPYADSTSRIFRSVPGSALLHRVTSCAIPFLDTGSVGQGSLLHNPHHHGCNHVPPAEDDPGTRRK